MLRPEAENCWRLRRGRVRVWGGRGGRGGGGDTCIQCPQIASEMSAWQCHYTLQIQPNTFAKHL